MAAQRSVTRTTPFFFLAFYIDEKSDTKLSEEKNQTASVIGRKFDPKEVAYLGINVVPEQDEYVLPFMKGTGYSFTPLRGTAEWAAKVYKVRGQPTNFLIDQQGRIVFSNFRTDANNHRELELMISSLLKRP